MRSRSTRVRSKIVALLVSLVALWAFAAYVTVQAGLNLLWINTLDQSVGRPTDTLVTALQTERRLSLQYLGGGRDSGRGELDRARDATDEARATLESSAAGTSVRWAADAAFEQRIDALLASLGDLDGYRDRVDAAVASDRMVVRQQYTSIVDKAFQLYDDLGQYATEIAEGGRSVVELSRAREMLAQEDALLTGILAAGQFAPGEPEQLTEMVGVQRAFYREATARLSDEDRAGYEAAVSTPAFLAFRELEDTAITKARAGQKVPFTVVEWRHAVEPVLDQLRQVENDLADVILERSRPAAIGVIVRLVLAGGLGLIAVIASIVVSITTARHLVRQLERLRRAAEELASYRLPRVVERLRHGERVDVASEAPPLDFGRDEIGRVGHAFNAVQQTAIQTAVDQAELRRGVRDVFLSLARRSQALLHRQLGLLDAMERRASDADELSELFRVDHLATRMRRNAENLIVLSGASAGRAWRRPVPMIDVLRGALAEIEDYTRVTVAPAGNASLIGRAVGDVIHLLAELIENAVSFSPPQTVVRVTGSVVGNGYAIEIEDRGLGMDQQELAAANVQLRNPPEFKLTSTARLGLYVVGKLAERHGIRVQLTQSTFGGVTAVVLLPDNLIAEEDTGEIRPAGAHRAEADEPDSARPAQLAAIGAARATQSAPPSPAKPASTAATSPATLSSTAAPSPAKPAPARPADAPPPLTPAGLPWRQKPAPAPVGPVVHGTPAPLEPKPDPASGERRREQLSSFRAGTTRGRDDAAKLTQPELDAPEWTDESSGRRGES